MKWFYIHIKRIHQSSIPNENYVTSHARHWEKIIGEKMFLVTSYSYCLYLILQDIQAVLRFVYIIGGLILSVISSLCLMLSDMGRNHVYVL